MDQAVEALGLPVTIGKDCILDALNAAGEASATPLIFCIDAVNENAARLLAPTSPTLSK